MLFLSFVHFARCNLTCNYVPPPLYRGGRYIALLLTAYLLATSVLCPCVLFVYHAGGQTRDVDPMSGYC